MRLLHYDVESSSRWQRGALRLNLTDLFRHSQNENIGSGNDNREKDKSNFGSVHALGSASQIRSRIANTKWGFP